MEQQVHQDQAESEAGSQVLRTVPSLTPRRKTSLQARITKEVEDPRRLPGVTAGAGHHQEGASGRDSARARSRQRRGVRGGRDSGQRGLYKGKGIRSRPPTVMG